MLIKVSNKHIVNGISNDCYRCPVALAVMEETGCNKIYTSGEKIAYCYVEDNGNDRWIIYNTPRSVKQFMKSFDNGKSVKPFKFYLKKKV